MHCARHLPTTVSHPCMPLHLHHLDFSTDGPTPSSIVIHFSTPIVYPGTPERYRPALTFHLNLMLDHFIARRGPLKIAANAYTFPLLSSLEPHWSSHDDLRRQRSPDDTEISPITSNRAICLLSKTRWSLAAWLEGEAQDESYRWHAMDS